jgi:hypothetical protein
MKKIWLITIPVLLLVYSCQMRINPSETNEEILSIFPDYRDVSIPFNIAPLNFQVNGSYSKVIAIIEDKKDKELVVKGKQVIAFPEKKWGKLLKENKHDSLKVTILAMRGGKWIRFHPFHIFVSEIPVDDHLVYRLIAPGYEVYSKVGIYQRDLTSYAQTALIENTLIPGSCMNCHSFRQTNPKDMNLHIRGKKGGTVLMKNGKLTLLNTKTPETISNFVYPYWHPSGEYIAYSVNNTHQVFHTSRDQRIEVIDAASDVIVYDIKKNSAFSSPLLKADSVYETFPVFSPDGRSLYFCQAAFQSLPADYQKIRYNLCRIAFNPETGTFGNKIDTLVNAVNQNKSISFPRPSYDGKYLIYTLSDYGNFSIWHKEADLWMIDLKTNTTRPLNEINSSDTESYHSWSSDSKWIVFSSRRIDGLYTRLYLSSISDKGVFSKPFLLPQRNPHQNEELMLSYNVPELVNGKVDLNIPEVEHFLEKGATNVNFVK